MAATVRIVPQGEIAKGTAEPPAVKLADPASFFSRRAARFRSLAAGEPGGASPYLGLMAELADAQQAALAAHPPPQPLLAQHLEQCRSHGLPPLGRLDERAPAWRDALHLIGRRVAPRVPDAVAGLVRGLSTASEGFLEKLADRILILAGGTIIADGSADELARRMSTEAEVRWTVDGQRFVHSTLDATGFVRELFRKHDTAIADLEVRRASLEDVYMEMVRQFESGRAEAAVREFEEVTR